MTILCYPKCTTCQKALAWLNARGVPYAYRNIKEENPSYEELKAWHAKSGLPLRAFFNTSGLSYKALNLKDRLPTISSGEALKLLSADGMLVKRPLVIADEVVLIGFREEEWEKAIKK
ncbi:MAG TPA: arsenate reductase family protein [Clostridia bacterium]|nr:arsenate reductase family protein [Clostridia bacterium]